MEHYGISHDSKASDTIDDLGEADAQRRRNLDGA
jgi:hypothetical protein